MKVLFAVNNDAVSESIAKKYQQMYKEIIVTKNVYYFNAILKELQKDKTYDRVVISEDLEPFTNNNYDMIDNFIFERLDSISDEATSTAGEDIPIILITTDRRGKSDNLLVKLFGIGVYSALIGQDRSIDEVCKLINKPRTKKEAKVYYKIDSNEVDYKPENESEVNEQEIQNILLHYKRLGKNEDRYVDSFNNIAAQYTDEQLKIIINYLPLNVKAVLEANSPKYQQLTMTMGGKSRKILPGKMKNNTSKAVSSSGITVASIGGGEKKLTKPVIIPSMRKPSKASIDSVDTPVGQPVQRPVEQPIQREEIRKPQQLIEDEDDIFEDVATGLNDFDEVPEVEEESLLPGFDEIDEDITELPKVEEEPEVIVQEPKRGRGRPRKVQVEQEVTMQEPKRGRGRPKKVQAEPEIISKVDNEEENEESILPGFDFDEDDELEKDNDFMSDIDNGIEILDDEEDDDESLPGFDDYEETDNNYVANDFGHKEETKYSARPTMVNNYQNIEEDQDETNIQKYDYNNAQTSNLQNLLTSDKKVVAFIGTSKNGTSFLINNLADLLSKQGIKTAILDLTKNRNAYYIYTKNEEALRKIAYSCTSNLAHGKAEGIKVNVNLDVYTSLPGENNEIDSYASILETLARNYSLVLLDCDFTTNLGYLKEAQELYLVQSMDVLTIQPLTAYLRDLKNKQILDPNKLRVVINKYTKVRGVTEKVIIGGMAFYNDPSMSFMTELFNRETVKFCSIPFDPMVYAKYLEGLINCSISVNGYQKEFIGSLRKLGNMVYPLISGGNNYSKDKYSNPKYNKYATNNTFSNEMNSTLDKMKRSY